MTGDFPEKQNKNINGFDYCYFDTGSGEPVNIFLHGMAGGKEAMWNMFSQLSNTRRCVFLDLPGHNGVPLDGINCVDDMAKYVEDFINSLNVETYNLIGFSMGGMLALTIENRNRVNAKLVKSVLWASPLLGYKQGTNTRAKIVYSFLKNSPDPLFEKLVETKKFDRFKDLLGVNLNSIEAELARHFKKDTRVKMIEMIKKWQSPTIDKSPKLLIFGSDDPVISKQNVEFVMKCDRNMCKLIYKPKTGHYGKREAWDETVAEVDAFLSS